MVAPIPHLTQRLTGRVRPRRTWWGKVFLQVEVRNEERTPFGRPGGGLLPPDRVYFTWRDALLNDSLGGTYMDEFIVRLRANSNAAVPEGVQP